jgi:hypothetical protein
MRSAEIVGRLPVVIFLQLCARLYSIVYSVDTLCQRLPCGAGCAVLPRTKVGATREVRFSLDQFHLAQQRRVAGI